MPISHLSAVLEYTIFAIMYYHLLRSTRVKKVIFASIFVILLLEIVNILFFENLHQFPSITLNVSQCLYVVYSLLLFRQMLLYPVEQSLFKQSIFWFNLDMLFIATTLFLNFALTNYLIKNTLNPVWMDWFNYIINMLYYAVMGACLIIDNKKQA